MATSFLAAGASFLATSFLAAGAPFLATSFLATGVSLAVFCLRVWAALCIFGVICSSLRASMVPLEVLILLLEPRDLVSTSLIPASSSTLRMAPPAIRPVP